MPEQPIGHTQSLIGAVLTLLTGGAFTEIIRRTFWSRDAAAERAQKRYDALDDATDAFREEMRQELNRQKAEILDLQQENQRWRSEYLELERRHDKELSSLYGQLGELRRQLAERSL